MQKDRPADWQNNDYKADYLPKKKVAADKTMLNKRPIT